MGTEAIIEEAFIDVFCDLVYGGGWMDIEREEVDRECNWALVSIDVQSTQHDDSKCLPIRRSSSSLSH
jgi:hypothetical protein